VSDQSGSIVKKKVRPYPFEATLELNALKMPVEIIFVSEKGSIVKLANHIVHVGQFYQMTFKIPVNHDIINVQVRILKTYDKVIDIKENSVERLAELHFQDLTKRDRSRINAFTTAIGQEGK
jgi:hypothetical protein